MRPRAAFADAADEAIGHCIETCNGAVRFTGGYQRTNLHHVVFRQFGVSTTRAASLSALGFHLVLILLACALVQMAGVATLAILYGPDRVSKVTGMQEARRWWLPLAQRPCNVSGASHAPSAILQAANTKLAVAVWLLDAAEPEPARIGTAGTIHVGPEPLSERWPFGAMVRTKSGQPTTANTTSRWIVLHWRYVSTASGRSGSA